MEPWLEYALLSVGRVAPASGSVAKFLAGERVEQRPFSVMMIDADHEPRRKMHDVISHRISSGVTSYAFGSSDRVDHGVNDLEQK